LLSPYQPVLEITTFLLPNIVSGLVLKELPVEASLNGDNDDDGKRLAVTHKFKDFTYWNLDLTPSVDDKIVQAMKWIDIANVVYFSQMSLFLFSSLKDGKLVQVDVIITTCK